MRLAQATDCCLGHPSDQRFQESARFLRRQILAIAIAFAIAVCNIGVQSPPVSAQQIQPPTLEQLKSLEKDIEQVAEKNMDACVAIFDGVGIGSGVIVSDDGLILTAGHVMSTDLPEYEVFFPDGKTEIAKRLGRNRTIDSGMIKLPGTGWPHVKIGSSDALKKGDWVVSLGHSGGFEIGRKPPVRSGRLLNVKGHQLITDAVLIGGDSGGPLFNLDGELVGIHSSIGDAISENRHARIEEFKQDWDRLRKGDSWGELPELVATDLKPGKAKLGVTLDLMDPRARVKTVKRGSAAARADLRIDDVIIQFDGEMITDGRHLIRAVKKHVPADTCFLKIDRNDSILVLEVRLH